jgi:hypothetical protein
MRVAGPWCRLLLARGQPARFGSLFLLVVLTGCGSRVQPNEPGAPSAGGPTVASTLGVVAGCKLQNNCGYGSYCNHETGFCESRKCSQGCPGSTVCNEGLDRCQDPPPARTPSDRLPVDDKIQTLPGTH